MLRSLRTTCGKPKPRIRSAFPCQAMAPRAAPLDFPEQHDGRFAAVSLFSLTACGGDLPHDTGASLDELCDGSAQPRLQFVVLTDPSHAATHRMLLRNGARLPSSRWRLSILGLPQWLVS